VHFIKYLSNPILVFYQLTFAHVSIFPIVRVKPSFSFSFLFSLYLRYEKSLVGYYAVHEILNYLSTFLTGLVSFTVPEVFILLFFAVLIPNCLVFMIIRRLLFCFFEFVLPSVNKRLDTLMIPRKLIKLLFLLESKI